MNNNKEYPGFEDMVVAQSDAVRKSDELRQLADLIAQHLPEGSREISAVSLRFSRDGSVLASVTMRKTAYISTRRESR